MGAAVEDRAQLGASTKGPTRVMTDLCVFEPDPETKEMTVTAMHPGVTRELIQDNTAWPVRFAQRVAISPAPTSVELSVLRDLQERTRRAHA